MAAPRVAARSRVRAVLRTGNTSTPLRQIAPVAALAFTEFELPKVTGALHTNSTLCLTPKNQRVDYGGSFTQKLPTASVTTIQGKPLIPGDVAIRFLRPAEDSPSVLAELPQAIRRANVFESALGSVLTWCAVPLLFVLLYVAVRTGAVADRHSIRRLAVYAYVIAFVHAALWAVLLTLFTEQTKVSTLLTHSILLRPTSGRTLPPLVVRHIPIRSSG